MRFICYNINMANQYKNSLQRGSIRFIIFKEGNVWYGAGLEFNIVESGDTPQEALFLLLEATRGYLKSAKKSKARVAHILNQKADPEYEKMWGELHSRKENRTSQPLNVFSFGRLDNRNLVHA